MRKALVTLALFLLVAFVYYESPVHYAEDSGYSLLMSEAILHQGSPNMLGYHVSPQAWTIAVVKGRLIYAFPWGLPILSLPAVAIANALGYAVAPNHVYSAENEIQMQRVFSALLSALVVCLVFEAAVSLLPVWWSLAIALSVAFGTQMWSNLSRSLWPQTWYLTLIAAVVLLLLRGWYQPALLATLLVWAGFVRPMAGPTLLIVGAYILFELKSRGARVAYLATGCFWAVVLGGMMLFFVGQLLAPVYNFRELMTVRGYAYHLAGVLFSPGRGLLVYVPIALIPLALMARYWRHVRQRSLAILALAAIFATTLTLAFSLKWWGGWSYGPRDLAETVPWLALIAILGVRAFLDDLQLTKNGRAILIGVAALLLMISVTMNAPGALFPAAMEWNGTPDIDAHGERLWDWRHPQFLAWVRPQFLAWAQWYADQRRAYLDQRRVYLEQRRAYLEERRQAAIKMQQQMLARGDRKAANRLGVVIRELDNQRGY